MFYKGTMNYIKAADQTFHERNNAARELKGLKDEHAILIKSIGLIKAQLDKLQCRVDPLEAKIKREEERIPELSNKFEDLDQKAKIQEQKEKDIENKKKAFYRVAEKMKKLKMELQVAGVPLENRN